MFETVDGHRGDDNGADDDVLNDVNDGDARFLETADGREEGLGVGGTKAGQALAQGGGMKRIAILRARP